MSFSRGVITSQQRYVMMLGLPLIVSRTNQLQILACLRRHVAVSEWACLTQAMRTGIIRKPRKQLDQPGLTSKLPDLLQPGCVQLCYNTVCHSASPSVKLSLTARI